MEHHDYTDKLYHLSGRQRSRRRLDLLLKAYSWLGFFLAIVASGYFLLTLLPFDLSMQQRLALMVAGVGALLSLMSRVLVSLFQIRDAEEIELAQEYERLNDFLAAWARFERASRDTLAGQGHDRNTHSLRTLISFIFKEGKIDREDVAVLEECLIARNSILHGKRPMSLSFTERLTASLVKVTKKIIVPTA